MNEKSLVAQYAAQCNKSSQTQLAELPYNRMPAKTTPAFAARALKNWARGSQFGLFHEKDGTP